MSERDYLALLRRVRTEGEERADRTGVGTYSLFGEQLKFDLTEGFPLLTTKHMAWKSIVVELLWFLTAGQDTRFLHEYGVKIWDGNASPTGQVGPIYGKQWRQWYDYRAELLFDQLGWVIEEIKRNPTSRRLLVSAWNVTDLPRMALPPCHFAYQFYVRRGAYLDCQVHLRSADLFLGVPFNIASYALLTSMVAQVTNLAPGMLTLTLGDVHLYRNHVEQADIQLQRVLSGPVVLYLNPQVQSIDDFMVEDIILADYHPQPAIPAPMAV